MSKQRKKKDSVVALLDLVIVLLVFGMIIAGVNLSFYYQAGKDSTSFMQDASRLSYELEHEDYAGMIQGKYVNEMYGKNDAKMYHAFADYVEAASLYKIYDAKGYATKASAKQKRMNDLREEMDELVIFADKVDGMLK